jgi:nucleotide-binding universal stress UspA family protein
MSGIVLGYDGSRFADVALETAIALARSLGEPLVIAFAAEPPNRLIGDERGEHRRALEDLGGSVTEKALARARERGIEAERVLLEARPAEGLVALADERKARLIVVGAGGEGPIAGAILGSTPYKLLHRARVPVLVVPSPNA